LSVGYFQVTMRVLIPSVAARIYSWEGYAAAIDFQERLVLQVQRSQGAGGDSLREANDCIMVDHCAALERCCERCH
jgi:hypothetical protein